MKDANNIPAFLTSEGYLTFREDSKAATSDLYVAYKEWCEDNAENALSMKSFANYLSQYSGSYHLIPDNNIYRGKGKRCRGYRGVEIIDRPNSVYVRTSVRHFHRPADVRMYVRTQRIGDFITRDTAGRTIWEHNTRL